MRRLHRARASSGHRRAPAAIGWALLGLGGLLPTAAWPQGMAQVSIDSVWMLGAWLLFGAACALVGAGWARRGTERQLHRLQDEARHWRQLSGSGWWRTDAQHQLLEWHRPVHGADASAGETRPAEHMASGQPLTALFRAQDRDGTPAGEGRLADHLTALSPWDGLRVVATADGQPWLLSARPCFDDQGHFVGHLGSAVPLAGQEQARRDRAVLGRLWPQLDLAALVLEDDGQGQWRVRQATPPVSALLRVDATTLPGQAWDPLRTRLPEALAQGLASLEPGGTLELSDWQARLLALDSPGDGPAAQLLSLHRRAAAVAPATETAADERDQESFIYSISHDLRAPIRVVEGFSRILKEDYGRFLDRIGNDHLDRVLAAAARMHSMIDALLALSRLQSQPLVRKPVDLSQLATYVMEDLRREQPERAAELQIEPGIVVQGDPTLLRIALENLLGNAWKYSGQCVVTHIALRRETQDGRPVIVVADQGAGFDMRFADRLFGVFQRLHSAKDFQGTGVGLASVRRIVRRHGGDIWAESEVNKGARFSFTLAP